MKVTISLLSPVEPVQHLIVLATLELDLGESCDEFPYVEVTLRHQKELSDARYLVSLEDLCIMGDAAQRYSAIRGVGKDQP